MKLLITIPFLLSSLPLFAANATPAQVGKVVILKGKAFKVETTGTKSWLKESSPVAGGDRINTMPESSLKIVLQDMTEMSLGPSSTFVIESFEKGKTSLFGVLAGRLRAKVTKAVAGDVKAVIQTPTATMGVRGTEFETIYNNATKMTSLVTLEGMVAMTKGEDMPQRRAEISEKFVEKLVDRLAEKDRTVAVGSGQFSALSSAQEIPTIPVKISPSQIEALKTSSPVQPGGIRSDAPGMTAANASRKHFLSPVPPGVDARKVVTGAGEYDRIVRATLGANAAAETLANPMPGSTGAPPEGFFDAKTGRMAPPAGGYIDIKTGLYVPPPPGSSYDPVAGVYVPPASMGTFDPKNGNYVPPAGYALDPSRGFVPTQSQQPASGIPFPGQVTPATASGANIPGTTPGMYGAPAPGMPQGTYAPGTTPGMYGAPTPMTGVFMPGGTNTYGYGGMVAAPPPPGSDPTAYSGAPGYIPPPATYYPTYPTTYTGGTTPAYGSDPYSPYPTYFDGTQPKYPTYDPFMCPPYCDPQYQPGTYSGMPDPNVTTTVTITVQ